MWIDQILEKSSSIYSFQQDEELKLIKRTIDIALHRKDKYTVGIKLAALYDLVISAEYYTSVTNTNWLYCRHKDISRLILPFTNCCPIHALDGQFVFHVSHKPTSAKIGQATTRVLLFFYQELFKALGKNIEVMKAVEPADAIFIDRETNKVLFAEIKSSPLLTLSLSTKCDVLRSYDKHDNIINIEHKKSDNTNLIGMPISIMLPVKDKKKWRMKEYVLGIKKNIEDKSFAYMGLFNLLQDEEFITNYLYYWDKSFKAYCNKNDAENIFWLTNACGKPSNLANWGGGTTCISDEKTSVGMDRTDDIKKGIYQVLKLGSEGKKEDGDKYDYLVGLLSNIHPARHFDMYLEPIKDLIWTICKDKNVRYAKDLPRNAKLYNLFDGIITFTYSYLRNPWLKKELSILK